MSSAEFVVKLRPDALLRRVVCCAGWLALVTGMALLLQLRLPVPVRILLVLCWLFDSLWELHKLARGFRRIALLRLHSSGAIAAIDHDGCTEQLTLLSGSLVLPRVAWLRLRFADGSKHAELLIRGRTETEAWHGLQLIWQHCRDAFGQTAGA